MQYSSTQHVPSIANRFLAGTLAMAIERRYNSRYLSFVEDVHGGCILDELDSLRQVRAGKVGHEYVLEKYLKADTSTARILQDLGVNKSSYLARVRQERRQQAQLCQAPA